MTIYKVFSKAYSQNGENVYTSYGIVGENDKGSTTVVHDISTSETKVARICEKLNRCGASPLHLQEIIEDEL